MWHWISARKSCVALIVPVWAGVLVSGGCHRVSPRYWAEEVEVFEFPAGAVRGVDTETKNGSIRVTGTADSASKVVVRANKRAGAASEEKARAALARLEVTAEPTDGGVVRVRWDWKDGLSARRNAEVALAIVGPTALSVKGETHNGEIVVQGVHGDVDVESHNGRLTVDHQGDRLTGETHNGAISARTTARELELSTHNGRIELAVAGEGELAGEVESHSGAIDVKLSKARSGEVELGTGNGNVGSTLPLREVRLGERRLVGRFGAGESGARLRVQTHNGSVGLEELVE